MVEEFGKIDLRNGMVAQTNRGDLFMFVDGMFMGEEGYISQDEFDSDLVCRYSNLTISKVYKVKRPCCFKTMFAGRNLVLIWERKDKIDWNKVPEGTKVQVRNTENGEWVNRYYKGYDEYRTPARFNTWKIPKDEFTGSGYSYDGTWVYCRLHESVKAKKEWLK